MTRLEVGLGPWGIVGMQAARWNQRPGPAKQTCEPQGHGFPHPRPSEIPSSTLSPQSIDQAQNRKPRATSPCFFLPPFQALNLAKSAGPGLALVLSPPALPWHLCSSRLRTALAYLSVPILATQKCSVLGLFP